MKVLFIARATLYSSPGGDTIQINKTAEHLRKLGVSVDIGLTNEKFLYKNYDLIHFFNIIRPADILYHAMQVKNYIISTIFVDYEEFELKAGKPFRKIVTKCLGGDFLEYLKALAKHFLGKEKIISKKYIFWGHKKSIHYLMKNARALLPNSINEGQRLLQKYGKVNTPIFKITNGIDIPKNIPSNNQFKNSIICIGRIERRKNQLNLIKAANELKIPCYIIGKYSLNDIEYYYECKKEAAENVKFIDNLPQEEVFSIMKAAKVHILPSWFETTGLVSLEAAYLDCNIVITDKGDQKEYFENYAYFCNPSDISSIKNAIDIAYNRIPSVEFKAIIHENYTWKKAAEQTFEVYQKILSN